MRRILCGLGALAAVGALAAPALAATPRVAICHATGSTTNPYVLISPAAPGIVRAHLDHQEDRDVVPPFTFRGTTWSQNWDAAGGDLYDARCEGAAPGGPGGGGDGGGGGETPGF
ncbi:hypothetical protein [Miltoncostaea marina]|uniref:hypothetical protein n=1 Tax=Miltoncostaea marina TaxID=2843215 RepID=UPI001C3CEA3F|nr:hypothetical protein [Miltoncostaea marina]